MTESLNVDLQLINDLTHKGLLLSDRADAVLVELRRRDEQLSSDKWHIYAALYHFMTKWRDLDVGINLSDDVPEEEVTSARQEAFEEFIARYGNPPSHFHKVANILKVTELPLIKKQEPFYQVLLRRKTTRAFDRYRPMRIEELSTILYYVYGCHGYVSFRPNVVGLKKTSPSGGDLHPIEIYPLILNVKDLDPGLYHYNVRDHSLELMEDMDPNEAGDLADEFTAGQSFSRSAHALFIMTARFYRNFWKYQRHHKAYSVLLMDAAHLSQTFYLVCSELRLGAFFTAAINTINIEAKLGLDGYHEGAIGICGCGKASEKKFAFDLEFYPYVPRQTVL